MKRVQVSEDILPIDDFKARDSEALSPEKFDALTARARFLAAVDEGLADVEAGRVVSDEELGAALDAQLGTRKV